MATEICPRPLVKSTYEAMKLPNTLTRRHLLVKKLLLHSAKPLTVFMVVAFLVLQVYGDDMLRSRFYIPEAKQPAGFPKPGKVGEIIVKTYPAYRAAVVKRSDGSQNRMFRTLFNHIKTNDIKMTAPVEMTFDDRGETSMAFLYRSTDLGELGKDGDVQVVDVPAAQVVSIAVRGDYTKENWQANVGKLRKWLVDNDDWEAAGPSRYLGYNSPFVPKFLRYGEIQIPIRKAG